MSRLTVLIPGDLDTPTGGYVYDRRIVAGLEQLGWTVEIGQLDATFPFPTDVAKARAAEVLAALPDGALALVDGLAYGAMPDEAAHEASRLRLVALVHHPLAAETGLPATTAARLVDTERRALAFARLVVVTSTATAASLSAYGVPPERIRVVEPGTDAAPLTTGTDGTTPALLCVASLTPRKGHETLFRALATLSNLSWHLTSVGSIWRDPAFVHRLRNTLRSCEIEDRVTLVGDVGADKVGDYYDKADLFVLPTRYEGYGMAVAEAVARGLPVISTPVGGIPEILGDTAGLLVPPGRVGVLADALALVLTDTSVRQRLAEGARQMRTRLPTWEAQATRMAEVLQEAATDAVQR
jgi:glycosyltransferase involved in cell wall biosynthesis